MGIDDLRPYLELEGICPAPVFIIGSPRSGTTALGHALGRHPELWTSKESYLINDLFSGDRAVRSWKHQMDRKTPSWLREEGVEQDELLGFLGLGVNALYSSRSGGRRWVDPTPLNTPNVETIAKMFPSASFIHIVRDGRRVVRSMSGFREMVESKRGSLTARELPSWADDVRQGCETWTRWVESALDFGEANPERCLTVRNERLDDDPESGFARIYEFLGVDIDSAPADLFARARINSSFSGSDEDEPAEQWWNAERRDVFKQLAGATLIRAGYAEPGELEGWARGANPGHAC